MSFSVPFSTAAKEHTVHFVTLKVSQKELEKQNKNKHREYQKVGVLSEKKVFGDLVFGPQHFKRELLLLLLFTLTCYNGI